MNQCFSITRGGETCEPFIRAIAVHVRSFLYRNKGLVASLCKMFRTLCSSVSDGVMRGGNKELSALELRRGSEGPQVKLLGGVCQ